MIYLDASAVMKLVRVEAETAALAAWLADHPDQPVATSELGRVEVLRAARRVDDQTVTEARALLGDIDLIPPDRAVQDLACDFDHPGLRTLDALHLASAVLVSGELTAFVTYDDRLTEAARSAGLPVVTPDRSPETVEG